MGIRVFAFDMDGTVLSPDKVVTARTNAALNALMARGIVCVPTTGRGGIPMIFQALGRRDFPYLVMANGAIVWDLTHNKMLRHVVIDAEEAAALVERLMRPGVVLYLNLDDETGTRLGWCQDDEQSRLVHAGDTSWNEPLVADLAGEVRRRGIGVRKVGLRFAPGMSEKPFFELARELGLVAATASTRNVEYGPAGVSKAGGLEVVCQHLGCTMADVCAIGDSGNDAQMLSAAGLGVAMGNADDNARAVADEITGPNSADGLAEFVERRLL